MAVSTKVMFGVCGIDHSCPIDELSALIDKSSSSCVNVFVAFQIAYQGYPWQPTAEYAPGAPRSGQRYGGLTYPSWSDIDSIRDKLPNEEFSFHLNETDKGNLATNFLRGTDDMHKLVETLVMEYKAQHLQVNIAGAEKSLFMPSSPDMSVTAEMEQSAKHVVEICNKFPDITVVLPYAEVHNKFSTIPFWTHLLSAHRPIPKNLCAFFDASQGQGVEPTGPPSVPDAYPKSAQPIGFTGGINPQNVDKWLSAYYEASRLQKSPLLVCDAQTGFRVGKKRDGEIDMAALRELLAKVQQWTPPEAPPQL